MYECAISKKQGEPLGGSTRRLGDPSTLTIDRRPARANLAPNRSQHPTLLQVQMPKTIISTKHAREKNVTPIKVPRNRIGVFHRF